MLNIRRVFGAEKLFVNIQLDVTSKSFVKEN